MEPIKLSPAIIASLLGILAIALPAVLLAKRSRKTHGLGGSGDGGWKGVLGKWHGDGKWKWNWKVAWK